jgi:UDP-N-acetylmuramoyl-tripeptide--D-alanyl-D-alanine ligase
VEALFLPDAEAAGDWLRKTIRAGDVVLVKGSRGVHLERAIDVVVNGNDGGAGLDAQMNPPQKQ